MAERADREQRELLRDINELMKSLETFNQKREEDAEEIEKLRKENEKLRDEIDYLRINYKRIIENLREQIPYSIVQLIKNIVGSSEMELEEKRKREARKLEREAQERKYVKLEAKNLEDSRGAYKKLESLHADDLIFNYIMLHGENSSLKTENEKLKLELKENITEKKGSAEMEKEDLNKLKNK